MFENFITLKEFEKIKKVENVQKQKEQTPLLEKEEELKSWSFYYPEYEENIKDQININGILCNREIIDGMIKTDSEIYSNFLISKGLPIIKKEVKQNE
jgi:hypothetical protein